jgi:hypothetical protein
MAATAKNRAEFTGNPRRMFRRTYTSESMKSDGKAGKDSLREELEMAKNVSIFDFFSGSTKAEKLLLGIGVIFSLAAGCLMSIPSLFLIQMIQAIMSVPEAPRGRPWEW